MTDMRDLLELINDALNASSTGPSIEYVDEIVRRLDMIDAYGGTEASNIKAILRTGRPLDGWVRDA